MPLDGEPWAFAYPPGRVRITRRPPRRAAAAGPTRQPAGPPSIRPGTSPTDSRRARSVDSLTHVFIDPRLLVTFRGDNSRAELSIYTLRRSSRPDRRMVRVWSITVRGDLFLAEPSAAA